MFLKYGDSKDKNLNGNIDKSKSLVINSCGFYHLYSLPELPTGRPNGRNDYQLIYIASGLAHFQFYDNAPLILEAGTMVLYRPLEAQTYVYYGKDSPEIYWIHFTGAEVDEIFREYDLNPLEKVFVTGTDTVYAQTFEQIILELQLQKKYYEDSTALLFRQLLLSIARFVHETSLDKTNISSTEIIQATSYFHEHYRETINIEAYIEGRYLSVSSFFRKFKLYTGMTPLQYLLDIRLSNAKSLLETTDYSIGEIAALVGYDNALYFSRLFHKHVGMSPREYRNSLRNV